MLPEPTNFPSLSWSDGEHGKLSNFSVNSQPDMDVKEDRQKSSEIGHALESKSKSR